MSKWQCIVCGFIYDEEKGLPEEGIKPGTKWEDIPDDWMCPDCGVGKSDFEMVKMDYCWWHNKNGCTYYNYWKWFSGL